MSSNSPSASQWTSRLGFILASAGSAVGLGSIWKFPYMAGSNGGAVFIIPYIVLTLTIGTVMLITEFSIGRAGRAGAIGSLKRAVGPVWGLFGFTGILTAFLILSFYSTIGGWCIKYLVDALTGALPMTTDGAALLSYFGGFSGAFPSPYVYQCIFLILNLIVILFGIQAGIERLAKVLMPTLFILMLVVIVRSLMIPGAWAGVEYLFKPDWSAMNGETLFNALGFTFFSLSLGSGAMINYGSYLSRTANIGSSALWVSALALMASILGGLMVMPAVFAFGLDPAAGPGLTFVTMPSVFSMLPGGWFFADIFFLCLVIAALTSSVSMLECIVTAAFHELHLSRSVSAVGSTLLAAAVGLFCCLSFGSMKDTDVFFGRNFFDMLDYLTSNFGMPITSLGMAVAAGWVIWSKVKIELTRTGELPRVLLGVIRGMIAFVVPICILVIAWKGIFG